MIPSKFFNKWSALFLSFLFLFSFELSFGQSDLYEQLWNDPEIQQKIENGIETHRKGWATINFQDEDGDPISGVEISIEQKTHDFLFGSNLFMLKGIDSDDKNKKYEDFFLSLFNYTTLPFYWKTLEPKKGNIRFEKDSEFVYRRPPPDLMFEFTNKHNIVTKGHPLVWDNRNYFMPSWLPSDVDSLAFLINGWIKKVAQRYDKKIDLWDVVNETTGRKYNNPMPFEYPYLSFKIAERHLSYTDKFTLNNTTGVWSNFHKEQSAAYLQAENLILKGAKVDIIGFNTHVFRIGKGWDAIVNGEEMTPEYQFEFLDTYARLGLPLHITEVTIPAIPNNEMGAENQAKVTEDFYRLWFSHPKVEAITWWNIPDGAATSDEDKWQGGIVNEDLSPKPVYQVLNKLINNEWKTVIKNESAEGSGYQFKGFYGKYQITVTYKRKTAKKEIHLSKTGKQNFVVKI